MPLCENGWSQEKATRHHAVITDEMLAQAKRSEPPPRPPLPEPRTPISRVFAKPRPAVPSLPAVAVLRCVRVV